MHIQTQAERFWLKFQLHLSVNLWQKQVWVGWHAATHETFHNNHSNIYYFIIAEILSDLI